MASDASKRIVDGPLAREVARFGVPLAVGMALQTTFNLVDAYLIAQLPREEVGPALGALGICDQIAALGSILSYGISTASGALLSRQEGAKERAAIQHTAWQSILLVGMLSVAFGVVGVVGAGPLVRGVIGAKGAVAATATRYLRVIVGGSFSIFFLLQLTSIQRALGSSKTPVALMVLGNVINVFFAIVLVFGPGPAPPALAWAGPIAAALHVPRMGMVGAAWATIFARALVLVPNIVVLARRFHVVRPPRGARGPDLREIRRILAIAWPSSAQMVVRICAMLLLNSLVARAFTTESNQTASTAVGLVFRLDTMALFVAMGWGSAAQTFVGQNLGAGDEGRATRSGWLTVAYDGIANVLLVALVLYAGESILRVFDDETAPIAIAMQYLQIVAPAYIGLGLAVVLGNAMAGAGATRLTMWIDLAVILGFQFPVSIVAVALFHVSIEALFRCVAITHVVGAIAYAAVYLRGGWRRAGTAEAIDLEPVRTSTA